MLVFLIFSCSHFLFSKLSLSIGFSILLKVILGLISNPQTGQVFLFFIYYEEILELQFLQLIVKLLKFAKWNLLLILLIIVIVFIMSLYIFDSMGSVYFTVRLSYRPLSINKCVLVHVINTNANIIDEHNQSVIWHFIN